MTLPVVLDTSCLIDLRKGQLLGVLAGLDTQLAVSIPVREQEVLCLTNFEWGQLDDAGVVEDDLQPQEVEQALTIHSSSTPASPSLRRTQATSWQDPTPRWQDV